MGVWNSRCWPVDGFFPDQLNDKKYASTSPLKALIKLSKKKKKLAEQALCKSNPPFPHTKSRKSNQAQLALSGYILSISQPVCFQGRLCI